MNPIKVTDSVSLRELQSEDAGRLYEIINSEREYLGEWLPFVPKTFSIEDTKEFVRMVVENPEREFENVFVILYEGLVVGLIGFVATDKQNYKSEIGYWISGQYQHRGIVTQSTKKLVEYGFTTLNLNRIQIKVAVNNLKSKKIPQRLAFRLEGIERDGELLADGKYTDIEIYGLLKREYL